MEQIFMKQFFYSSIILLMAISAFVVNIEDSSSRKVGPTKERVRTSGAMEALDFWSTSRAYPNRVIPDVGHYAAFEHSQQYLQGEVDHPASVEPWRPIGPHNIGGRTISIAFNPLNPNTVYAGSAGGGLWRSYAGGVGIDAWDYVSTGFPVLGVNSIAVAPNDSNIIYIGTGEVYGYQNSIGGLTIRTTRGSYGIGILKTTDAGLTWSKSLDWAYNQTRGVQAIRINPLNPNAVWAATTEGTYKSLDAGLTWTQVHNVIMANDLAINPLDTNIVFAACGNLGSLGHGIYRTTDGGATWLQLTAGLPATFGGKAQLAIYQSSPNMIFASIGNGSSSGALLNIPGLVRTLYRSKSS
jgi:hypothetical protein